MQNTSSSTSTPTYRKPRKVGKIYHTKCSHYVSENWYTRVHIHRLEVFFADLASLTQ
jgi:hypothetical protein